MRAALLVAVTLVSLAFDEAVPRALQAPADPRPAQAAADPPLEGITISANGTQPEITLAVEWLDSRQAFVLFLMIVSRECHYDAWVAGQIIANGIRRSEAQFLRSTQDKNGDTCVEGLGALRSARDLGELGSSSRVTIVLPTGPIEVPKEARDLIRVKVAARAVAVHPPAGFSGDREAVTAVYLRLLQAQRYAEALGVAEHLVSTAESLSDRVSARLHIAAVRRTLGDIEGAASVYEEAIAMGRAATDGSAELYLALGVLADNLGLLRGIQGRYDEGLATNAVALAMFERSAGPRSEEYGGTLNNRSLLFFEAGRPAEALTWSTRALDLMRELYKDAPERLQPFLEDNRIITSAQKP